MVLTNIPLSEERQGGVVSVFSQSTIASLIIEQPIKQSSTKLTYPLMSSSDISKSVSTTESKVAKRGENEYYDTVAVGNELQSIPKEIVNSHNFDVCYISLYTDFGGSVLASYGVDKESIPIHDRLLSYSTLSEGVSLYPEGDEDERFQYASIINGKNTSFAIGVPITNDDGVQIGALCCVRTESCERNCDEPISNLVSHADCVSRVLSKYRY